MGKNKIRLIYLETHLRSITSGVDIFRVEGPSLFFSEEGKFNKERKGARRSLGGPENIVRFLKSLEFIRGDIDTFINIPDIPP